MAKKQVSAAAPAPANRPPYMLIEEIRVQGYKSLVDATLHVRPLTLLAGTNSSGKSSIMQPLLLIKQTMEAPYQPAGALVLDGAHVQAETAGELVSKNQKNIQGFVLNVSGFNWWGKDFVAGQYEQKFGVEDDNFRLMYQKSILKDKSSILIPNTSGNELSEDVLTDLQLGFPTKLDEVSGEVISQNGFLRVQRRRADGQTLGSVVYTSYIEDSLAEIMHIPGLRGGPRRSYSATSFQNQVKGTFDIYTAGTISQWQEKGKNEALNQLNDYLRRLGLTDSVTAKVKNANEVELSVSRLPAGSKGKPRKADMVNIADVGIGVSQVLPILVALIAAQEGQIVYVEQPELHLHPRAQVAMAELLAEAANRGVRVIVETHSSLLLLTVQTMVAEAKIKPEDVALHWFSRDAKGATTVRHEQPDENGAYGDWPEDFGDVEMTAQRAYLDAVTKRRPKRQSKPTDA